jgi:lambda repressor-like predicted transcriptional regulator
MHPEDIKGALRKAGTSAAKVALDLKVSKTTMSEVIHGKTTSRRIARAIAKALGATLDDLWPGRYAPKPGDPKRDPAKLDLWKNK